MVDEYQDTNAAQFELVHSLTKEHRNFCVVGDDDQSIYGWRGAEIANLLDLEKHYPEVKVVKLEQNYRSTTTILTAANAIIKNNTRRRAKSLWSQKGQGTKIALRAYETDEDEARNVVEQIEFARLARRIPALLAVSLAGPLQAQAPDKGKLLVATEDMSDPNYRETVVLLLHHDDNGTIGVAVNRPTWVEPEEVVAEIGAIDGFDGKVFRGGPIGPTQLIYLVRDPPVGTFDAPPILDGIHASGNLELVPRLSAAVGGSRGLRLYAGHSEWTAGQVQREISRGQWIVVDASEDRVFGAPEDLWRRMLTSGSELLVDEVSEPAAMPLARRSSGNR
jgi:putative AlgH/UPF0301 family transcriptional regulator